VATRFFDKSLKNIFGLSPDELRISQLITDEEVQKHLEKAEILLDKEKYLESIVASRDAFENALFKKKQENRFRIDPAPLLAERKENGTSFRKNFLGKREKGGEEGDEKKEKKSGWKPKIIRKTKLQALGISLCQENCI
jgi:hypothetical protein